MGEEGGTGTKTNSDENEQKSMLKASTSCPSAAYCRNEASGERLLAV